MRSHEFAVNKNRLLAATIAHSVFNLFRRLSLPDDWKKFMVDEIRLRVIKVASRIASHAQREAVQVLQQLRIPGGVQGYTLVHSKLQVFRCCDNRIDNLCSLKTKPC